MKKLVFLAIIVLLISFTVTVFAQQEQIGVTDTVTAQQVRAGVTARITNAQKTSFKTALQTHFNRLIHGYGIGFTEENYITAKWHITRVRILNTARIRSIIQEAKEGDDTDWDAVRDRVREALTSADTSVRKGRIRIAGRNYILTNIETSDDSLTADIREMPDYTTCKEEGTSAEDCEDSSNKVGEISITRRSSLGEGVAGEPRVWAGTLTFNDVDYTFVTFAYPR